MGKHFLWIMLLLLGAGSFSAKAAELLVYSVGEPERFVSPTVSASDQDWQTYFTPPHGVSKIVMSNRGQILYQMHGPDDNWDWYALDRRSRKAQRIAQSRWFNGFLNVMPFQRSDGSYFAKVILPQGVQVYRVGSKGPQLFLNKPGLYDFLPLPDGSYAYVLWTGQGKESPDFADFIPGQTMQLWHVPLKGKARLLGRFDTVLELQHSGQQLLFFTPGKTKGALTWKLRAQPLQGPGKQVAEIPKSNSRGAPTLISWAQSDWVVYPAAMTKQHENPVLDENPLLIRHHLRSGSKAVLPHRSEFIMSKGQGAPGYLTGLLPALAGESFPSLVTYALESGEEVQRIPYSVPESYPDRAMFLP
jgi:hypothetical protein